MVARWGKLLDRNLELPHGSYMVRTEVELPEEIYEKARIFAEEQHISLQEVMRRGVEQIIRSRTGKVAPEWKLEPPANTELREDPFADSHWRDRINVRLDDR